MSEVLTRTEKADYRRRLFAAVERLPRRQRLVIGLRFRMGLSLRRVANVLHYRSWQLVHFHEQQALKALRASLPRPRFIISEEGGADV